MDVQHLLLWADQLNNESHVFYLWEKHLKIVYIIVPYTFALCTDHSITKRKGLQAEQMKEMADALNSLRVKSFFGIYGILKWLEHERKPFWLQILKRFYVYLFGLSLNYLILYEFKFDCY